MEYRLRFSLSWSRLEAPTLIVLLPLFCVLVFCLSMCFCQSDRSLSPHCLLSGGVLRGVVGELLSLLSPPGRSHALWGGTVLAAAAGGSPPPGGAAGGLPYPSLHKENNHFNASKWKINLHLIQRAPS